MEPVERTDRAGQAARPELSLVIPCYNEAANLPLLLERCGALLAEPGVEVVLVDNGSTDDTAQVLAGLLPARPGCRSVRVPVNRGYGYGILAGLAEARGAVLGWTHADLQTDPQDALQGLALFRRRREEAQPQEEDRPLFVKGRRIGRPLADAAFTAGMSLFETLLLARPMRDINAQPTLFPRAFYRTWRSPPHDFSLDLYAYHRALVAGLEVRRFPVRFGERAHGVSHWNVNWAAKWKFIRRTMAFSLELRRSLKSS